MPTTRQDEAPAGTTPPRPGNIRDAIVTAAYRTAHLTAPAALALLLLAAALVAGGAA
ncbi:hypothetical protein [Plasticicumulans sp.]|uniref:hypothetical protein n=1 Tax=Plasticicumulans sp. TaxID=2307179 RepID=UPI00321FF5D2